MENDIKENEETVVDLGSLALSDEDFEKMTLEDVLNSDETEDKDEDEDEESTNVEEESSEDTAISESAEEEDTEEEDTEEEEEESTSTESEKDSETDNETTITDDVSTEKVDNKYKDSKDDESVDELDYKAEYFKLLAPFKANSREIKVDNIEDARRLMSMGANYNKKMQGLKPNLKLIKMLDNNELLDESKLSFLIDLSKKDASAIKKLVKDSGIDPLEFDDDKSEYKPKNTYTVDDKDFDLDNTLEDIKDSPTFNQTVNIISNKWDEPSKAYLRDNPAIIQLIDEHVASGAYEKINNFIEHERMLGNFKGISDIEAYKLAGDAINARGGFSPQPIKEVTKEAQVVDIDKNTSKADETKRKERKKSASSTKSVTSKKTTKSFNPLALSDEDFEKELASTNLM